jgi:phage terminase large subunit-like protein
LRNYGQIAEQYCYDVAAGRIVAGNYVKLACARHLRDLAAAAAPSDYPYTFSAQAAARVCGFVEKLPHIKGPLAGTAIELAPWQVFILACVFGWLRKDTGKRRYRRAYIEVPRGNGKSAFTSPIAIYMLAGDKEGGPEVYSAARTKEQAGIVFDVAKKMLQSEVGGKLRKHFGIQVLARSIVHPASNGIFTALASEAESLDGKNVHFACLDELHAHPNSDVHDSLDTATGKRDQSLMWMITTAGTDQTGICYNTRDYVIKILEGTFEDESYFGIVYTLDKEDQEGDKWATAAMAAKANPNYGISVYADDLAQKCKKALQQVSAQTNYKTKHLNIWQSVGAAWMDMLRFHKCADPGLKEADFLGQPCVVGLDLASKLDLLTQVRLFWKHIDGKRHYYAFWQHWTPQARIDAGPVAYRTWALEGRLQVCPGETNDITLAEDAIREACQAYDVKEVAHDPWGALELVNRLTAEGVTMFQVDQVTKNLSPSMKELEAAIYDGRFHFDGDPVATWAMSNVIAKPDKKDNVFPFKLKPENKIDPIVALCTAVIRVMATDSVPAADGGGVSVFGPCSKCQELCIGQMAAGKPVFLCSLHR